MGWLKARLVDQLWLLQKLLSLTSEPHMSCTYRIFIFLSPELATPGRGRAPSAGAGAMLAGASAVLAGSGEQPSGGQERRDERTGVGDACAPDVLADESFPGGEHGVGEERTWAGEALGPTDDARRIWPGGAHARRPRPVLA